MLAVHTSPVPGPTHPLPALPRPPQSPFSLQGPQPCGPATAWWVPLMYVTSRNPAKVEYAELEGCKPLKIASGLRWGRADGGGAWLAAEAGGMHWCSALRCAQL